MSAILLTACKNGALSIQELSNFVKGTEDANSMNEYKVTALMHAAIGGQKEIAEFLISEGASINAQCDRNQTALICATLFGHKEIVELLLKYGANINSQDYKGYTALHYAAGKGFRDIAELLLEKGANKNIRTSAGKTAAQIAQECGKLGLSELLSDKKAGCFIATAVYDSVAAPEVVFLQGFRDEVLLKKFIGRIFVHIYYRISPPIAKIIPRHSILKQFLKVFCIQPAINSIKMIQRRK
jgi:hypothetical protein